MSRRQAIVVGALGALVGVLLAVCVIVFLFFVLVVATGSQLGPVGIYVHEPCPPYHETHYTAGEGYTCFPNYDHPRSDKPSVAVIKHPAGADDGSILSVGVGYASVEIVFDAASDITEVGASHGWVDLECSEGFPQEGVTATFETTDYDYGDITLFICRGPVR